MNSAHQFSILLTMIFVLVACGQVGELYLPEPTKADPPAEISATPKSRAELEKPRNESSASEIRAEK